MSQRRQELVKPARPVPERIEGAATDAAKQLKNADTTQVQRTGKKMKKTVEIRAEATRAELDPSSWAAKFTARFPDVEVVIYPTDGQPWRVP